MVHATGNGWQRDQCNSDSVKVKEGIKWTDITFYDKNVVFQEQPTSRTNLGQTVSIVGPIGWENKTASVVPFCIIK